MDTKKPRTKNPREYSKNSVLGNGLIKITVYMSDQNIAAVSKYATKEERSFSKIVNNVITEWRKGKNAK